MSETVGTGQVGVRGEVGLAAVAVVGNPRPGSRTAVLAEPAAVISAWLETAAPALRALLGADRRVGSQVPSEASA